jgi:hypothetical protein
MKTDRQHLKQLLTTILVGAILTIGASLSFAQTTNMICSAAEAISCAKDGECIRGPVDKVNLPLFFKVDFTQQMVYSMTEAGEKRNSPIASSQSKEGSIVILGSDPGVGWSMVINETTGLMTLGVAETTVGYTIFGACIKDGE